LRLLRDLCGCAVLFDRKATRSGHKDSQRQRRE
jgi:hypothetical protein